MSEISNSFLLVVDGTCTKSLQNSNMLYQRDVVPFCDAKFCKNTVYNNAFFL